MTVLQSGFGVAVFVLLAWVLSEDRRRIPWRIVITGLTLQLLLALAGLHLPLFRKFFVALNDVLLALEQATQAGTSFVFGYLGGGPLPFEEKQPGASFVLAFRALPLVLIVSALSALLYYWRVLPWIVQAISRALAKSMGIGGALGVSTAANIFVGMIEAPLFIRPYLKRMSRFELFAVMVGGMAGIAGTMMVLYASILRPVVPDSIGHILIASLLSAPAAILVAALMIPPDKKLTGGTLALEQEATSSMDALTRGTLQGVALLLNIVAMLVVFVALVALANMVLGLLPLVDGRSLTFQRILGWLMAPLVWLMGIPWSEAQAAGALMGTKTILNEFIAYLDMARLPAQTLSERSRVIMTYALCGFANFGSLGIMIGGLSAMVPQRRQEIVRLGMKSIIAGTLATMMTGAVVGLLWRPSAVDAGVGPLTGALCIGTAPATVLAVLPTKTFTLAWNHSVEKIRWEEDYRVEDGRLIATAARVRGSGAGMEPPAGARLRNGAWEYTPKQTTLPKLVLARSSYTGDYELCWNAQCSPFAVLIGKSANSQTLDVFPCLSQ